MTVMSEQSDKIRSCHLRMEILGFSGNTLWSKNKEGREKNGGRKPPGGKSLKLGHPSAARALHKYLEPAIVVDTVQEIEKLLGQDNSHLCTHQSALWVLREGEEGMVLFSLILKVFIYCEQTCFVRQN